jgi:hypothetical protein
VKALLIKLNEGFMGNTSLDNELRQYFLGQMTEKEKEAIELMLFEDDVFYQNAVLFENELIDTYLFAKKDLSIEELGKLEAFIFSSPERIRKLNVTKFLKAAIDENKNVKEVADESQSFLSTVINQFRDLLNARYELIDEAKY